MTRLSELGDTKKRGSLGNDKKKKMKVDELGEYMCLYAADISIYSNRAGNNFEICLAKPPSKVNFDWKFSDLVRTILYFCKSTHCAERGTDSYEKICLDKISDLFFIWLEKLEFSLKNRRPLYRALF